MLSGLRGSSLFSEVKLADGGAVPTDVQILRVGKFDHPQYGKFEITKKTLAEMKKHFDERVRGIDIAFDYFHNSEEEAAGWPKALELRDNGNELWATGVEWTPTAAKKLADREIRYFSPDFAFEWKDPESGKKFSNVLFGGGLTNRPFIKEMQPIVAAELAEDMQSCVASMIPDLIAQGHDQEQAIAIAYSKCGEKKMADYLNKKGTKKMDEKDKEIAALKTKVEELEKQHNVTLSEKTKRDDEVKKLQENVVELKAQAEASAKERAFEKLLSEGKAVAAQKEAYLKGDMAQFAELAQKVNLSAAGNGKEGDTKSFDEQVMTLAAAKCKEDKNLSMADAIPMARKEIKAKNK